MSKVRTLSAGIQGQRIEITYPDEFVPIWFSKLFTEMVIAYWTCASRPSILDVSKLSKSTAKLIQRYFEVNELPLKILGEPDSTSKIGGLKYTQDKKKIAIMFSGGKDSVHLAIKLIEKYGRENLTAFYVKNINKSESYYETRAAENICKKLEINLEIIRPTNSIKLNRMNHNISLRGELVATLALPYLIRDKISKIYFGTFSSFKKIDPPMFGEHEEALEYFNDWIAPSGLHFDFHEHFADIKIDVYKDMVQKHRDILNMTSSCYTQLNFREHRYVIFKDNVPDIPIYDGCGSCIKCLRINSAILLFDPDAKNWPKDQIAFLLQHFVEFSERYPNDGSFQEHLKLLISRYKGMSTALHSP